MWQDILREGYDAFTAAIRNLRKRAGLTKEELAERADLRPVYISQIERGTKAVSVPALSKLSKSLRVPIAAFLWRNLISAFYFLTRSPPLVSPCLYRLLISVFCFSPLVS